MQSNIELLIFSPCKRFQVSVVGFHIFFMETVGKFIFGSFFYWGGIKPTKVIFRITVQCTNTGILLFSMAFYMPRMNIGTTACASRWLVTLHWLLGSFFWGNCSSLLNCNKMHDYAWSAPLLQNGNKLTVIQKTVVSCFLYAYGLISKLF